MPSTAPDPAVPPRRSPWIVRGLVAAVVVAGIGFLLRDTLFGTPVDVVPVTRGSLIQTVVASGRVTTPQRVAIGSAVTKRVATIPVAEGQAVRRGDVLIRLDDRDERAAVAQAEATVAQAEAKLVQLREVGLPAAVQAEVQAAANQRLARAQYERNQDLKGKGFISQSALDDAKRNLDVADSQLRAARLQVQTNGAEGSDVRMAQTALVQAQAARTVATAKLEQLTITAPADGLLIARNVEPGMVVQPGKELMTLAPTGETQVVVQIDEKNLAKLRLGQPGFASADAYPQQRFPAEVSYINPGVDPLRGAVEVKLRVAQPPAYLRQDMTVSVDIEVARRADALIAPADAVFDAGGAKPWVLAVVDSRTTRRPVRLGLRGEGQVEIVEGVAAGDRLVPAGAGIGPDQRVRATVVAPPPVAPTTPAPTPSPAPK